MRRAAAIRIIYPIALFTYLLIAAVYAFKFEISYRIVQVRPELVAVRSLTTKEASELDRAYHIRITISTIFIYFSVLVALFSYILLKNNFFKPVLLLKVALGISLFVALILIIANGISFIPGPPPQ